ncbi:MAG TPA: hypothetical protein VGB79_01670 [Allosphingosinicella sp.]|jgi:hypothetical protein
MKAVIAAALGLIAAVTPASAQRTWGESRGWTVFERASECVMGRDFEGDGATMMAISEDADGLVVLHVANMGWSIERDAEFTLVIRLGDRVFDGPATGYRNGAYRGFNGVLTSEIVRLIGASGGIEFYRKDGETHTLIDDLALDGTGVGLGILRRCVAALRVRVARERADEERLSHIPPDPFARPTPPAASATPSTDARRPVVTVPATAPVRRRVVPQPVQPPVVRRVVPQPQPVPPAPTPSTSR